MILIYILTVTSMMMTMIEEHMDTTRRLTVEMVAGASVQFPKSTTKYQKLPTTLTAFSPLFSHFSLLHFLT